MKPLDELRIYGEPETWSSEKLVCLHALADQHEALRQLGMQQNECTLCDLYWEHGEVLFFVCIATSDDPGVTLSMKSDSKHPHSFYIRTKHAPLTTTAVNITVAWLGLWLDENNIDIGSEEMIKVSGRDILDGVVS